MITLKERNGLTINNPDEGEKTLFIDTDGKLKTKNENGLIEEVAIVSASAPKVYKALLTQTGTAAPVATVLENTLGGTVVWTRTSTGYYSATLNGAFTLGKTFILNKSGFITVDENFTFLINTTLTANSIEISSFTDYPTSAVSDNILISFPIEILVYP